MDFEPPAIESSTPLPTDMDLIAALRRGQVESMRVLYNRYVRLVYSLAFRILGNSEEAEDITQEVFLALWRQDAYQPDRGSLSSFLMTLTRSRSIDRLRSQGSRTRFLRQWQGMMRSEAATANPFESLSRGERADVIQVALSQLPETQRRILEIAYYEGLSQSEIARRLDLPLGTVKTRSRQALMKLRQILKDRL